MKKYQSIAIRYMIKNRARSISIIIGIALSLALVMSFGILLHSAQKAEIEKIRYECGDQHVEFHNITLKQAKIILKNQKLFKTTGLTSYYGYYYVPQKNCIFLCCADPGYMKLSGSKIIRGRFPSRPGEIALDEWTFEALGLSPVINQKISMNVDYHGLKSKEEFIVVGIMKDRVHEKANSTIEGLIPLSQVRDNKSGFDFYVEFKPQAEIGWEINRIAETAAININSDNIIRNNTLLEALDESEKINWETVYLWIIVFILAFLVVSSIYRLSIYQRIRDYGMLRIIGATKRQVRAVIYLELFLLFIISTPIGILLGLALANGLSGVAGEILVEGGVQIQKVAFASGPIISGIIIVLVAVTFSAIKTIFMIQKISPLEAAKTNAQTWEKKVRHKSSLISCRLSTLQNIVYQHLKRNRKNAIVIIISMALGSILFMAISMYGAIDKASMQNNLEVSNFNNDFSLTVSILNPLEVGFNDRDILNIQKIRGVKEVKPMQLMYSELLINRARIADKPYFDWLNDTKFYKTVIKGVLVKKNDTGKYILKNNMWGYNEAELKQLKKYLVAGDINIQKMKSEPVIVLTMPMPYKKPVLNIKVGNTIKVRFQKNKTPSYYVYDDSEYINKEFKVGGIVSNSLMKEEFRTCDDSADIIMDQQNFKNCVGYDIYRVVTLDKQEGANSQPIHEQLRTIANSIPDTLLRDLTLEKKDIVSFNKQRQIFLYGIVIVLFLIGIINIANSINFNFISRKKEFAMMRAVGLIKKQLNAMIVFEGLFYGIASTVVACIIGTAAQFIIYNYIRIANMKYPILWKTYIAVILINIFVALIITYLAGYGIRKSDILDSIRGEE